MSNRRGLTLGVAMSATLAISALSAAPAMASSSSIHPNLGRRTVCAQTLGVRHTPGGDPFDYLTAGESFDEESKDASGNWAYGAAYGHVNAYGRVLANYFC